MHRFNRLMSESLLVIWWPPPKLIHFIFGSHAPNCSSTARSVTSRSSEFCSQSVWKRMDYKLGACLSWPYCIRIKGQRGAAWRATAGLGFPLSTGQLNVSFYYDRLSYPGGAFQRGEAGLIVSITLSELFYHARL